MFLSVEQYNMLEKKGKRRLSNRFLEAFAPDFFEKLGFPTRIETDNEVVRFFDSMHDGRLKAYYTGSIGLKFSPDMTDFQIIKNICSKIYKTSKEHYEKGIVVKAPLLASVDILRNIEAIMPKGTIFEIGGGCGVLGVLLHEAGYRYISTDVTQAFYLTQNHLWHSLYGKDLTEYPCVNNMQERLDASMLHIPYWNLWDLRHSELEADVIVANHCLAELHPRALLFYLQYGKQLLRNSKYGLLLAQSTGWTKERSKKWLNDTIINSGYELLLDFPEITVFSLVNTNIKSNCNPNINFTKEIPSIIEKTRSKREAEKVDFHDIETYFKNTYNEVDTPDEEFIHYLGLEWI